MNTHCAHIGLEVRYLKPNDQTSMQSYHKPQTKRYICHHHNSIPTFLDLSHHQVLRFYDIAFPLEHHINDESNTAIQSFKFVTNSKLAGKSGKDKDGNQM